MITGLLIIGAAIALPLLFAGGVIVFLFALAGGTVEGMQRALFPPEEEPTKPEPEENKQNEKNGMK